MAERGGFEPSDGQGPSTDFESAAFDHSATSPLSPRSAFQKVRSSGNLQNEDSRKQPLSYYLN